MPQKINKFESFVSEFESLIVDDTIKEFIFGDINFDECLRNIRSYPLYMNNCLTLAYIYVYSCYSQMVEYSDENDIDFKNFIINKDNNNARVLNSLKKTYVQYPLTPDLIQFVILDLQFDMLPGAPQNLNRVFGQFCDFSQPMLDGSYFNLVKYFNHIAKWRLSPQRYNDLSNDQLIDLFLELVTNMKFLHGRLCLLDDGGYAFMTPRFYNQAKARGALFGDQFFLSVLEEMEVRPFVDCVRAHRTIVYGDYGLYYLSNIDRKADADALELTYVHTQGDDTMFIRVSEFDPDEKSRDASYQHVKYDPADYYYEVTGLLWNQDGKNGKKKEKKLIDQIHTINYKYIKNLALSVSDAISRSEEGREVLSNAFSAKYPSLFTNVDYEHDLDSIVIMLMIEESPTYLLEVLFSGDKQLFYDIVTNIDRRFDDDTLIFHNKSKGALANEVDEIIRSKLLVSEHNSFKIKPSEDRHKNDYRRLRPSAQALLIVSSLSKLVEEERQNEYIYAGNIFSNIQTLKNLKSNPSVHTKIEYVRNILIDTFKHLLCFYSGVFAYGDRKAYFDLENMNTCLPRNRIAAVQKELVDSFMFSAVKFAERFKSEKKFQNHDVFVYIDEFIALCKQCYKNDSTSDRSFREQLYSTVGKYEILDLGVFKKCIAKHLGNARSIDETNADSWIDFALAVMGFFKTGSFSDAPNDHKLLDAVYPFTASYSKRNENRDGQITVTFTISIDIDNDGSTDYRREINVLTEFSYDLQEVFYCLPNVQRSNDRWWIDPLLINFKTFNDIFK